MKIVWQTTNNNDMIDLADNVVSLNDDHFSIESTIEKMKMKLIPKITEKEL